MEKIANKIIELSDVSYNVGGVQILKDINLTIKEGEFVSFVGPSGIGKTTLLKMILGNLKPTTGKILVDGKTKCHPDTVCDIVYQKFSLFPHLKVVDNIILGLENKYKKTKKHSDNEFNRKQTSRFITRFYLGDAANKYPYQLSVGMQQRVAIAQALILKPKILLLDEPFSALDPWVKSELHDFLLKLFAETKMTMILVTHDLEEAIYLSSRVIMLDGQRSKNNNGATVIGQVKVAEPYPRTINFKTSNRLNVILSKLYKHTNTFHSKDTASKNVEIITMLNLLQDGQDLIFANALIGKIVFEMGKKMNDNTIKKWGLWIETNNKKSQKEIDSKVVWIFSNFTKNNDKTRSILEKISNNQTQHVADKLIMNLLVEIGDLYKIF